MPGTLDLRECNDMKAIDIFYQGEGIREIGHLEFGAEDTIRDLKHAIEKKNGLSGEFLVFIEDQDEPASDKDRLEKHGGKGGIKIHLHRCRQIKVAVTFNGETVHHPFSPATTIARVKQWAAVRKFGMSEDEAGEHVLQIAGTHDRPAPNVHIGTLAAHPGCSIGFDLVPDERVNGASSAVDSLS